jgi:hypothetical protein
LDNFYSEKEALVNEIDSEYFEKIRFLKENID